MLSAPAVDLTFDDDEWTEQPITARFYSTASTGSWGVTSIGRGFNWNKSDDDVKQSLVEGSSCAAKLEAVAAQGSSAKQPHSFHDPPRVTFAPTPLSYRLHTMPAPTYTDAPIVRSPVQSRSGSPIIITQSIAMYSPSRSPSSPRPRRRSSQQRISLVAGRVMIAPVEQSPLLLPQPLRRSDSASSALSVQSTRPPSPSTENQSFLGEKRITDFIIEGEIGRGAYGLVKRAREALKDSAVGPQLVIKQIIKNRILADCWKKHAKLGTIPIEIYVMSAISNTSYVLPPRRAWDPARACAKHCLTYTIERHYDDQEDWINGKVVKGHPNICPLLDFFEDSHFYYLVLPCTTPETRLNEAPPASDLFELVESYPHGLPPGDIRTYLGQIADALGFLHSHGIVHRDVKDENVVLGPGGKCILIDFGSSGIVRKNGWDTFSGTLDYAGPEILRGERYYGKEQDVWAFGVVAYVLLVGECPFTTAGEAQDGLESPFANASITLDERCADGKERDGEEADGGGALGDAAALVRECLRVDVAARPTMDRILQSRFLIGNGGWGLEQS
ncbi:Protein kinase-like domain containing protein [Amanita muscaria]